MAHKPDYFSQKRTLKNTVKDTSEVSGIAIEDRARVVETAFRLQGELSEWAKPFPIFLPERIFGVCLACAAMCLGYNDKIAVNTTKISMILFALDDVADGVMDTLSDTEIEKVLQFLNSIIVQPTGLYHGQSLTLEQYLIQIQNQMQEGAKVPSSPFPPNSIPVENSQASGWVQLAAALSQFCEELRTFDAAEVYYPFFVKRFDLLTKSMLDELHWRQAFELKQTYPTYADYMSVAQESIASATVVAALLVRVGIPGADDDDIRANSSDQELSNPNTTASTNGTPFSQTTTRLEVIAEDYSAVSTTNSTQDLNDLLDQFTLSCGAVIRLANDIRSFERERLEHKPNSLTIRMLSQQVSEKQAETITLAQIEVHLAEMKALYNLLPKGLCKWGAAVVRLATFAKDFYLTREFHDFTKEMLIQLRLRKTT